MVNVNVVFTISQNTINKYKYYFEMNIPHASYEMYQNKVQGRKSFANSLMHTDNLLVKVKCNLHKRNEWNIVNIEFPQKFEIVDEHLDVQI